MLPSRYFLTLIVILQQKTLDKLRDLITHETEYRKGHELVAFFNSLGSNDIYAAGFPSRGTYVAEKLSRINGTAQLDQCIKKLLSPVNFVARINDLDTIINDFNQYLVFDGWKLIREIKEIKFTKSSDEDFEPVKEVKEVKEDDFLKKEFNEISLDKLGLDGVITEILTLRFEEIKKCLQAKASLSVIFLSGSSLEGILLGMASKYPKEFNQSKACPKDKEGKPFSFHQWTLNNFIDVAYDVGLLKEDVKKFSHSLRDFRNYIHPYEQMSSRFNPDEHTAKISWQVLKAALFQLSEQKINKVIEVDN
jgi:hypothetical protein